MEISIQRCQFMDSTFSTIVLRVPSAIKIIKWRDFAIPLPAVYHIKESRLRTSLWSEMSELRKTSGWEEEKMVGLIEV